MIKHKRVVTIFIFILAVVCIVIARTGLTEAKSNDIENEISNAVVQHNNGKYLAGAYACESHHTYTSEESSKSDNNEPLKTYYVLYVYNEYNFNNGEVEKISGGCSPAAITFKTDSDGNAELYEFREPRLGESYSSDMAEKFPIEIESNDSDLAEKLEKECDNKAKDNFMSKS